MMKKKNTKKRYITNLIQFFQTFSGVNFEINNSYFYYRNHWLNFLERIFCDY